MLPENGKSLYVSRWTQKTGGGVFNEHGRVGIQGSGKKKKGGRIV